MPRGAGGLAAPPPLPRPVLRPARPVPLNPVKAVMAAPRIKPISTREYGKGGTPLGGAPDMGVRGAGIGFAGNPYGT